MFLIINTRVRIKIKLLRMSDLIILIIKIILIRMKMSGVSKEAGSEFLFVPFLYCMIEGWGKD